MAAGVEPREHPREKLCSCTDQPPWNPTEPRSLPCSAPPKSATFSWQSLSFRAATPGKSKPESPSRRDSSLAWTFPCITLMRPGRSRNCCPGLRGSLQKSQDFFWGGKKKSYSLNINSHKVTVNAARTCLGFTNNSARSMKGRFKRAAVLLGAGKAAGSCRSSRELPAPAGHGQDPPQLGQECLHPTEEEARWGKARCSTCQGHSAPFSLQHSCRSGQQAAAG